MEYIISIIFAVAAEYAFISSRYGWRTLRGAKNWHNGIDIATGGRVVPMYWFADGYVSAKGYGSAAGNYLYIVCPSLGKKFYLYHMAYASPLSKGQAVSSGTLFGYCGTTGNSTGVHLHISVVDIATGKFENPEIFFKEFEEKNAISPISKLPIRLKIGDSTGADTAAIKAKLDALKIGYELINNGIFITDEEVTAGDQVFILRVTKPLGVECVEYVAEDDDTEIEKLKAQNAELEKTIGDLNKKCDSYYAVIKDIEHTAASAAKGE